MSVPRENLSLLKNVEYRMETFCTFKIYKLFAEDVHTLIYVTHTLLILSSFLPVGVLFMTASYIVEVGDNWETLIKMGKFILVVVSGYVVLCTFDTIAVAT